MYFANRVALCFAIVSVAGVHGHSREVHVVLPLRDPAGNVLEPSLFQGVDALTDGIAERIISSNVMGGEQWGEEDFLMHNNITAKSAFCFTIANDTNPAEHDGDEALSQGASAILADNRTLTVASINGLVTGHWCCHGHAPAQNQVAQTTCYQTDNKTMLDHDGLGESEEGLLQASVGADGSGSMASVRRHEHARLVRSEKRRHTDTTTEDSSAEKDPWLYPNHIFMASLRDGLGKGALDLAAKQLAHLARATSGLILVDGRLLGRLVKELGRHPARSRVMLRTREPMTLVIVGAVVVGSAVGWGAATAVKRWR